MSDNHKPSDKYRDRLTRNANDFDSIVSDLLAELDSMAAWEQAKALKEEARDELRGMAVNNHKELRERLRQGGTFMAACNMPDIVEPHDLLTLLDLIDRLEREKEELRKDAGRYRWLRSKSVGPSQIWELLSDDCQPPYMSLKSESALDTAIDAAMKEEG